MSTLMHGPNARRAFIGGLLALFAVLAAVAVVEAASSPWSCDSTTNNTCPTGSKYSRAKLHYTILGGSLNNTDWRFDERVYGGSNGYSGVSQDEWRLLWASDWSSPDGQSWTKIAGYGAQSWHGNDAPWSGYTVGSPRTVDDERGISLLSHIEHRQCSPNPFTGCFKAKAWITWGITLENSVFN